MRVKILFCALSVCFFAIGCGNFHDGVDPSDGVELDKIRLSPCGGLVAGGDVLLEEGTSPYTGAYCDAEVVHWLYDPATELLELVDARAELNCCGDHDVAIEETADGYVVTEIDALPTGGSRCRCVCVFDFALKASPVPQGVIHLEIERIFPDDPAYAPDYVEDVWAGDIDLAEGAGWELIDDTAVAICP